MDSCQHEQTVYICLLRKVSSQTPSSGEESVDCLMDPVSTKPTVHGAFSLHVDDLLMTGDDAFEKEIMGLLRKDFHVGSKDKNGSVEA